MILYFILFCSVLCCDDSYHLNLKASRSKTWRSKVFLKKKEYFWKYLYLRIELMKVIDEENKKVVNFLWSEQEREVYPFCFA